MKKERTDETKTTKEQTTDRSTSGGGLGQGREMAAGMPEDQLNDKGRPGKGMGGTSDTGEDAERSDETSGS